VTQVELSLPLGQMAMDLIVALRCHPMVDDGPGSTDYENLCLSAKALAVLDGVGCMNHKDFHW
jgi:hypothetical protein